MQYLHGTDCREVWKPPALSGNILYCWLSQLPQSGCLQTAKQLLRVIDDRRLAHAAVSLPGLFTHSLTAGHLNPRQLPPFRPAGFLPSPLPSLGSVTVGVRRRAEIGEKAAATARRSNRPDPTNFDAICFRN